MKEYSNFQNFITELSNYNVVHPKTWNHLVRKYKKDDNSIPSKNDILKYIKSKNLSVNKEILGLIKMKPTRTISGVTPLTIFTKPYKCSGNCIFCPSSADTPKSYLLEEPGIQRASQLKYNPFEQVRMRMKAFEAIGHNTEKIELIILGGTWDDYELSYRIWYIAEVFRALNSLKSQPFSRNESIDEIQKLQEINTKALHRCVGLCVETRPDKVNVANMRLYRQFGVTKVQLGAQTLNEKLLTANNRGHSRKQIFDAIELLRLTGFKIHIHWMCNLYKSNPKIDFIDFTEVFKNEKVKPDEIKIYPCALLKGIKLHEKFLQGGYQPYELEELTILLTKCKKLVPKYCRINRLMRDIPSQLILEGNKVTNLREHVQKNMQEKGHSCKCIRCREVKKETTTDVNFKMMKYKTSISTEYFLEYVTKDDKIAGFLRLSIYTKRKALLIDTYAMVRELHVYGTSLKLRDTSKTSQQHTGLGTKLLLKAEKIVQGLGLETIAIISGIGTRNYYKKRGYVIEKKYGYALKTFNNAVQKKEM